MNDRQRIIEAARLQRTMLRLAGVFVLALAVLVWSLVESRYWVTLAAIPATLISVVALEAVNIVLQLKIRAHWLAVVWPFVLLAGLGALSGGIGSLEPILIGVLPVVLVDCAMSSQRVTTGLKNAGVRVGFLGVREEELRRLRSGVCLFCGYNLTGLPTAVCPECGKESTLENPAGAKA
ncbi:MAG: hypothetical protein KF902_01165 [Phycisphaeraceae bacterium]|nr:hypothetical protein [Phycisphaeraceae bacterium]